MTVQLPPFVVEQTAGATWRYGEIPGCEILARCDNATTERTVSTLRHANQLLGLILPDRFRIQTEVPETLILYDGKLWPPTQREAFAVMLLSNPARALDESIESAIHPESAGQRSSSPTASAPTRQIPASSFFDNLQLTDADSMTTFVMVSNARIDPWDTVLTPAYVGNLINARSPPLPAWFKTGFLGLYRDFKFREDAVTLKSYGWDERKHFYAKDESGLAGEMRPIGNFLELTSPGDGANAVLWAVQAELFVSWGIDPQDPQKVDGFWKLVERCCTEPPSESLFRECFGFDCAEATKQLLAYSTHTLHWNLDRQLAERTPLPLRDATPNEIARLKGEWERLETRYVRKNLPDLVDAYSRQARRTLLKAFDQGDRDPRLLATLGLLELDAHHISSARQYLEDAVSHSVVRPRAYFELAQLRYEELLDRSTRNDRKLNANQTEFVLAPLLLIHHQSPSLPQVYELIADVCTNSAASPDFRTTAVLEEGSKLFPTDRVLTDRIATLRSNVTKSINSDR